MPIHEYVVRYQDGHWQVRVDDRLVSGEPSQMGALHAARALAGAAAGHGERSKITVIGTDGGAIEFPVIGPAQD